MNLCVWESEEYELGLGAGVHVIIMSDVIYAIGRAESSSSVLTCLTITIVPVVVCLLLIGKASCCQ